MNTQTTAFRDHGSSRTLAQVSGSSEHYTLAVREKCDWFETAAQRLKSVSELHEGWDSYGARPVDSLSVHYAHCLLSWLRSHVGISQPKISATPSGRVRFV